MAACLERIGVYIQLPWGAPNTKYMDTTRNSVEDDGQMLWKNPANLEVDSLKEIRCANCRQDHPAYSKSRDASKKEKKVLVVKHKINVSFQEGRKIVGTYMGENSNASVARRVDTTNEDNEYKTLAEKLIQLETNDCSKFLEAPKKQHSAEL